MHLEHHTNVRCAARSQTLPVISFHAVKNLTTAEGGALVCVRADRTGGDKTQRDC